MIAVPPESSLGPKMLALTEAQRAFVIALVTTGGGNNAQAAAIAGYGGSDVAQRVAGHHLAHNPKVQEAIREEAEKRLRSGALLGASVLIEVAMDPLHKDRVKAAESLLNRSGLLVETQQKITVEHIDSRSTAEIQRQTLALAERLGVKLPQIESRVIDAECEEVGTLEGLDDIL